MTGDIVFNADGMEQSRAGNESTLGSQISEMESTRSRILSQVEDLEEEAAALESAAQEQDVIAATAMKVEYYTDSRGNRRSRQVPDTAKRADAKSQAATLRSQAIDKKKQAAALRAYASALALSMSTLDSIINLTNAYIRKLIEIVQNTDVSHAQKMDAIGKEVRKFIARYQSIFDSFNDRFPLTTDDMITLSKMGVTAFTAREFIDQQTQHLQNLNKDLWENVMGANVTSPQAQKGFLPTQDSTKRDDFPRYNGDTGDLHGGRDYANNEGVYAGDNVLSPWDGKVVAVHQDSNNKPLGNRVVVEFTHNGTLYYGHFAHLADNSNFPEVGSTIKKGDSIGSVGNTSSTPKTPNHLHLEVTKAEKYTHYFGAPGANNSNWVDPDKVLPKGN